MFVASAKDLGGQVAVITRNKVPKPGTRAKKVAKTIEAQVKAIKKVKGKK